jgi:hypothetical protein
MENWEDKIWKRCDGLAQAAHQRGDIPFTIFQEAAEFGPVYWILDTTYVLIFSKNVCKNNYFYLTDQTNRGRLRPTEIGKD